MRVLPHTLRPLHDNIGPSSITATGVTAGSAMLVTTLYGSVAEWVQVKHRQVAERL
jgi:hypothetical protein